MKTFESITGFKPHTYKGRIITFGLTEDENNFLKILFHSKDIEIYDADIASDLVALFATAIVVNATKLEVDDFALLENYYKEVGTEADEIVFWLGSPKPAIELQMLFKCFNSFDEIVPTITKILSTKV